MLPWYIAFNFAQNPPFRLATRWHSGSTPYPTPITLKYPHLNDDASYSSPGWLLIGWHLLDTLNIAFAILIPLKSIFTCSFAKTRHVMNKINIVDCVKYVAKTCLWGFLWLQNRFYYDSDTTRTSVFILNIDLVSMHTALKSPPISDYFVCSVAMVPIVFKMSLAMLYVNCVYLEQKIKCLPGEKYWMPKTTLINFS